MSKQPTDTLKRMKALELAMAKAKKKAVFVGLPSEKVGSQIYGDGQTIMTIGAIHEFGAGNSPKRSFLRTPFLMKEKEIGAFIAKQFEKTLDGEDIDNALGLIGAYCTNISKKAFTTNGFGEWEGLKPATVRAKGSSQVLIDTGTLRNSITWAVRND